MKRVEEMYISCVKVIFVCWLAVNLCSCSRSAAPQERAWFVMGTYASISAGNHDAGRIDEAQAAGVEEFQRLEQLWSDRLAGSEVSGIAAGTGAFVKVSQETYKLFALSAEYASRTDGLFDATVGPLVNLWGIGRAKDFRVPEDDEIQRVAALCGWRNLEFHGGDSVRFAVEGMRFDPGGIGKGLAVDICFDVLREAGFRDYMLNLGGNMRCLGSAAGDRSWRVGVRNPFDQDDLIGVLELPDGYAVATSGNYERFAEKDGVRYAHILNPVTGRPVQGMAGVTVVGASAVEADALSTALFVAGIDNAQGVLRRFEGAEAILIPDRRPLELYVSKGMLKYYTPPEDIEVRFIGE